MGEAMNAKEGLGSVVAGTTRLSRVRADEGELCYAGYDIADLARHATFEDVCHLLWYESLPDEAESATLSARLLAESPVADRITEIARSLAGEGHPMAVLRTALSAEGCADPDAGDPSREAAIRKAMRLTARTSTITAAIGRLRLGHGPMRPHPALGLAANFLYMLHGREPDAQSSRALDVALVLHAEHGMNASTLAARIAAATLTDMHSAVVAGLGALSGRLHGGANEWVMRMLMDVGSAAHARAWVRDALARGERIMGFGHRAYRAIDPRAPILERLSRSIHERNGDTRWIDVSSAIREAVEAEMGARGRTLYPNVDFYSASLYHALGIPVELFPCMFACARMAGWTAHVMEQHRNDTLILPDAEYTGPDSRSIEPTASRAAS
jgi:citrate synthase